MTGRNRANPELDEKKARESEKQAKLDELYKSKFNKGMKQVREREEKLAEMAELVKEDFTRYADNTKMNEHLKDQLLEDDPIGADLPGRMAT
ncbi:hypothetical protein L596_014326 [Steinernema carpocapsae]|nr:hypothetical protein L596_014326 [Steinernema carpocapsae]